MDGGFLNKSKDMQNTRLKAQMYYKSQYPVSDVADSEHDSRVQFKYSEQKLKGERKILDLRGRRRLHNDQILFSSSLQEEWTRREVI